MPILHMKASGYCAELSKPQSLIQMPCMDVAFHDSIELKHSKSQLPALSQTIQDQFLPYVPSSYMGRYSIAGIANVPAATNIIGVENV